MSEGYDVDGVTVTGAGGGWYELTHSSLETPERVQGKENADNRAREIAKGATGPDGDEGSMPPQGDIADAAKDAPAAGSTAPKGDSDEVAELKAKLAAETKAREKSDKENEKLVKKLETKTVTTDGGEVPAKPDSLAAAPRAYTGILDDKEKARLKKLGLNTKTIILDDNPDIPPTGLFLGHNGRGYVIATGEPVDVPDFLLGILDDAVMSAPVQDSKSQKILGYRSRRRYNYREV